MNRSIVALLSCFVLLTSAAQYNFERTYGGTETDLGLSVEQTSDGGYMLFGSTSNSPDSTLDMLLIKVDPVGNELWSQTYGTMNLDAGFDGHETSDGGFILCGAVNFIDTDSLTLVRTNANGDLMWIHSYPAGVGRNIGYAVQETVDGGFVACGYTQGVGVDEDVYVVRTDNIGDVLWYNTIDLGGSESAYSIQLTSDSGMIVLANSITFADPDGEIHLLRFDQFGDTLWTRTYADPGPDETHGLAITDDGGFIIAGGNGYPDRDVLLIRTDDMGMELWRSNLGSVGDDMLYDIQVMDDGGFIGCGRKQNMVTNNIDMLLYRTDSNGNFIWERTFPSGVFSEAFSLDRTNDGGFVLLGIETDTLNLIAYTDLFLVKTDGAGYTSVDQIASNSNVISCYPNPANDRIRIRSEDQLVKTVYIVNAIGQLEYTASGNSALSLDLDIAKLASGHYILEARFENGTVARQQVIVAR